MAEPDYNPALNLINRRLAQITDEATSILIQREALTAQIQALDKTHRYLYDEAYELEKTKLELGWMEDAS